LTRNTFVLDTNVLLHDPYALYKFQEHKVIIPIVVVEEVDKFKRDQNEVGRNARTVSRFLDNERKKGKLSTGVKLESGGLLQIVLESDEVKTGSRALDPSKSADNWILGVAVHYAAKIKRGKCILVTKDANLRIKADALGILAEDYTNDKVQEDEIYQGWIERKVPAHVLRDLETKGSLPVEEEELFPNLFLHLVNEEDEDDDMLARVLPSRDGVFLKNRFRRALAE